MTPVRTPDVTTRPATDDDEGFLLRLFRAVRGAEFSRLAIPAAQLDVLLRMQYEAQKRSYGARYPGGQEIVLVDGEPSGRIWTYRGAAAWQLVDLSLLPEFQSTGIGSALARRVVAAARTAGVRLRASVARTNPGSLAFAQRLGFQIVGEDEVYHDLAVEP